MLENLVKEVQLKMIKGKNTAFILNQLYCLNVKESSNENILLTKEVNDKNSTIKIKPDWFESLTLKEREFYLSHTVLHYTLKHDTRKESRDEKLWLMSSDIAVNNIIDSMGLTIPKSEIHVPELKGYSTEQIYDFLNQENQQQQQQQQSGDSDDEDDEDTPNNQELQKSLSKALKKADSINEDIDFNTPYSSQEGIKRDIETAESESKVQSKINKGFSLESLIGTPTQFYINELGKVRWERILKKYINEKDKELTYTKFDRRMLQQNLYLPAFEKIEAVLDKLVLAFDVSGSVSERQAQAFLNEIKSIKEVIDPNHIEILTFNTEIVQKFDVYKEDSLDSIRINLGGGTDLKPVFDYLEKSEEEIKFLLVFSDLECERITKEPKYPVHWICIDNPNATVNFGELIHIKG